MCEIKEEGGRCFGYNAKNKLKGAVADSYAEWRRAADNSIKAGGQTSVMSNSAMNVVQAIQDGDYDPEVKEWATKTFVAQHNLLVKKNFAKGDASVEEKRAKDAEHLQMLLTRCQTKLNDALEMADQRKRFAASSARLGNYLQNAPITAPPPPAPVSPLPPAAVEADIPAPEPEPVEVGEGEYERFPARHKGSKYTGWRNATDIARDIRSDIKDAVAAGELPKGLKVSVRQHKFAGGQAVDCTIKNLTRVQVYGPEEEDAYGYMSPTITPEAARIKKTVEAIRESYNLDRSDPMVDYFNVLYYGSTDWGFGEIKDKDKVNLVGF